MRPATPAPVPQQSDQSGQPDQPEQPAAADDRGRPELLPSETVDRLSVTLARAPGTIGCAVRLDDGRAFAFDANRVHASASTIKVPILVSALLACQEGRLSLDEPVALPPGSERVGGSGPILLLPSLEALPLREILTLMIALSDNDATNAVIGLLGFPAVAEVLAQVPTRHTRLERTMMNPAAVARGEDNETSAADLVAIVVALRDGRLLDRVHTETALAILRTQQFLEGLPAYLPESVTVASKTGSIPGMRGDVALFERDGRWAVVAVLASDLGEGEAAVAVDRGTAVLPAFADVGEAVAALL
ncbi:MAG: serine hydrolase [Lapillicoccus sp.]